MNKVSILFPIVMMVLWEWRYMQVRLNAASRMITRAIRRYINTLDNDISRLFGKLDTVMDW